MIPLIMMGSMSCRMRELSEVSRSMVLSKRKSSRRRSSWPWLLLRRLPQKLLPAAVTWAFQVLSKDLRFFCVMVTSSPAIMALKVVCRQAKGQVVLRVWPTARISGSASDIGHQTGTHRGQLEAGIELGRDHDGFVEHVGQWVVLLRVVAQVPDQHLVLVVHPVCNQHRG